MSTSSVSESRKRGIYQKIYIYIYIKTVLPQMNLKKKNIPCDRSRPWAWAGKLNTSPTELKECMKQQLPISASNLGSHLENRQEQFNGSHAMSHMYMLYASGSSSLQVTDPGQRRNRRKQPRC